MEGLLALQAPIGAAPVVGDRIVRTGGYGHGRPCNQARSRGLDHHAGVIGERCYQGRHALGRTEDAGQRLDIKLPGRREHGGAVGKRVDVVQVDVEQFADFGHDALGQGSELLLGAFLRLLRQLALHQPQECAAEDQHREHDGAQDPVLELQ